MISRFDFGYSETVRVSAVAYRSRGIWLELPHPLPNLAEKPGRTRNTEVVSNILHLCAIHIRNGRVPSG